MIGFVLPIFSGTADCSVALLQPTITITEDIIKNI